MGLCWHADMCCVGTMPTKCAHYCASITYEHVSLPTHSPKQAFAQRSDHLAVIAAFNAWSAAKAAGGRGAAADFARQHFMSDQVGFEKVRGVSAKV